MLQLTRRCFWFIHAVSCWEAIFFQIWTLISGFTSLLTLSSFPSDFANALFAANTSQASVFSVTSQWGKISVWIGSNDQGYGLVAVKKSIRHEVLWYTWHINGSQKCEIINGWLIFQSIDVGLWWWIIVLLGVRFFVCVDYGDGFIDSIWTHYIYIHYKHKATDDIFT